MKTLKFLTLLLCLSVFSFVNKTEAQVDITVSPIGLLFGDLNAGIDFMVNENISAEVQFGLTFGSDDFGVDDEYKYFGLPITVLGKYYFNPNNGADRFYADVFLKFVRRSYSIDGDNTFNYADYANTRFGLGFGLGYKLVSSGGFIFEAGIGAGRAFVDKTSFDDGVNGGTVDLPNVMITGKLGVGYRFGG